MTNETASAASAIGAVSTCTSAPPSVGPRMYDSDRLPLQQRAALDVQLTRSDRDEDRRPRQVEPDSQGTDEEPDDVQLLDRQDPGDVGSRHAGDHDGAGKICPDHDALSSLDPFEPHADREREEQVREPRDGGQQAHVARIRVQHEDRRERQRKQRDLVADDRDRLAQPERSKIGQPEQGWHEPPGEKADGSGPRTLAVLLMDVIDSRVGHEASERGVRTSAIVEVDVAAEGVEPLAVGAIRPAYAHSSSRVLMKRSALPFVWGRQGRVRLCGSRTWPARRGRRSHGSSPRCR